MFGVQCEVIFRWIFCVSIVFCQVSWTQAEYQPIPKCLTGYMTDVQNWVDRYGRLRPERGANDFIDLSAVMNPVPVLHRNMTSFRTDRRSVKYLSMARCNLRKVPPVFTLQDTQGRCLGETVEYITFFGNEFTSISQPDQYGSSLNATGATEIRTDSQLRAPASTVLWSAGFLDVEFKYLKELDLRACSIQILKGNLFRGMKNLEALYLGENEIYSIDSNAFDGLPKLIHLDMSRNHGTDEFGQPKNLVADAVFNRLNNLVYLDLSFTKMTQRNIDMLRGLGKNLRSLSLCDTGLANLPSRIFSETSLEVLDVSRNNGILSVQDALRGLEDTLQILYAKEVRLQSIDMFQNFTKLQILTLASNEISVINGITLKSLKNLRILDLNKNRLTTWFDPTYALAPKLKLLDLKENNINIIIDEMIKDVANVSYFALSGNFIVCNCYAKDFFKIAYMNEQDENEPPVLTAPKQQIYHKGYADYNKLLDKRKVVDFPCKPEDCNPMKGVGTFRLFDYDSESYSCLRVPDSKSVNFVEVAGCDQARDIYYEEELASSQRKLFILVIIPIVILPLGIIFVFRRNLRYCIITIRNSAMISLINKKNSWDDGAIYNYDVFVSYCNEDRNWVLDYLLPHMEAKCSISVCLHERDFQVGLSILENIVSCMDRSRSIMLIISRRFLLSQWCQFEMHLAQHRLLETRREDLTLVLVEEIPRSLRPNTLHYLMMTKTYIVWPEDEVERPLFWKRLQRNLLTHKIRHTENVSLA